MEWWLNHVGQMAQSVQDYSTDVENAGTVTFWAANKDEKQISSDYDQKLNSKVNINFNKNGYNRKNKQIKLGMENKKWTFNQRGFVSGEVDFR